MSKELKPDEELIKVPVSPGDAVFIKFPKTMKNVISVHVFKAVIPC